MDMFGGFFSNESTFGKFMTKAGNIIVLNILFFISCVPFLTIGAAAAALYHAIFEMLDSEAPINPLLAYWRGLRKHFLQATAAWLAFAAILAVGLVNLQVCKVAGGWLKYLSAGVIAVLFAAVIVIIYLFPVLTVFSGKLREKLKLAICISMSNLGKLLLILILHVVPLAAVYVDTVNRPTYAFIAAFFGCGLLAYVVGKLLAPQFEAYLSLTEAG